MLRMQHTGIARSTPSSTRRRPGAACPASGRVQSVRARWELGSPPAGYTGSAGGGVGHARDKIFQRKRRFQGFALPTPTPPSQNETYLIVQVSKNSKKYKKTPFGA